MYKRNLLVKNKMKYFKIKLKTTTTTTPYDAIRM